jgi:hypothetical protein
MIYCLACAIMLDSPIRQDQPSGPVDKTLSQFYKCTAILFAKSKVACQAHCTMIVEETLGLAGGCVNPYIGVATLARRLHYA